VPNTSIYSILKDCSLEKYAMKFCTKAALSLAVIFCALASGSPASAQTVTTGSIAGVVMDAQGGVLPGATVTALHTPTGTSYEGVTDEEGRFNILNVRVGPYDISANMSGFRPETLSAIEVKLSEQSTVGFKLQVAAVTETVEVSGDSSPIDPSRAGTTDRVSAAAIEALPTISRSLTDMARTSAYFNPIALNEDPLAVSVAGRNNRYNNVQIDGAVNNDVFGLAASGTPGGQTETQPISLDAIQELQLVVSPYDVRQGGFSGGGINAITKSGSNRFSGTGYFFGRNQDLVGEGVSRTPIAEFKHQQMGGSLGGRIIENKAFFFTNADFERRDNPSGISVSTTGQTFGREPEVDRFLDILRTRYNYDPGGKEEFIRTVNSDKFFIRGDLNPSARHQLIARYNLTDSLNDIGRPTAGGSGEYFLPDAFYRIKNLTHSTVVQLNSTFGTAVNEARFTLQKIQDRRAGQPFEERPFPFVQVRLSSGRVRAGRENFSTANELDQNVYELSDDFTWLLGKHTLTLGTKNEFFKFRNLFIRNSFGRYEFANLDLFEQGLAQSYDFDFSLTSDPLQSARFRVRQFGFYAGDQWRPASNFTLTLGVRADIPTFPDKPTHNPAVESALGLRTDEVPTGVLWSPRVGFNYALSDTNREQVRGGFGLFAGRTPYVWLSNQYGNTGVEFRRLSQGFNVNNRLTFVPDVNAQPRTLPGGPTNTEVDVIDPDYTYPSLMRGNLAYDRALPFLGLVGTAELLYSKNVNDIKYQNLNLVQRGTRTLDGRPFFTRDAVPGITDLILLTNTDEGDAWSIAFKVERPYSDRFFANASYLYGRSRSIMDGTSSQAASNWNGVYVPGDSNNAPLTRSNFDPGHRITMSAGYDIPMPVGLSARVALFYSGQSGRPWSALYSSDANGDVRATNDLLYIPTASDNLTYTNGTYEDLLAYVNAEPCLAEYIGRIHERNACRSPWVNTFDLRFNVGLPVRRAKVELTWDVLNVLNLIDSDSGLLRYANFNDLLVVTPTIVNGQMTNYNLQNLFVSGARQTPEEQLTRSDLLSRWQMQFGARIRF
jgi:hypothetical protein